MKIIETGVIFAAFSVLALAQALPSLQTTFPSAVDNDKDVTKVTADFVEETSKDSEVSKETNMSDYDKDENKINQTNGNNVGLKYLTTTERLAQKEKSSLEKKVNGNSNENNDDSDPELSSVKNVIFRRYDDYYDYDDDDYYDYDDDYYY